MNTVLGGLDGRELEEIEPGVWAFADPPARPPAASDGAPQHLPAFVIDVCRNRLEVPA